jgi:hypothetical protein
MKERMGIFGGTAATNVERRALSSAEAPNIQSAAVINI